MRILTISTALLFLLKRAQLSIRAVGTMRPTPLPRVGEEWVGRRGGIVVVTGGTGFWLAGFFFLVGGWHGICLVRLLGPTLAVPHLHFLTADTRFIAVVVQRFGHTVTQVHWLPDPVHAEPHLAGPGVADH